MIIPLSPYTETGGNSLNNNYLCIFYSNVLSYEITVYFT